MAMAALVQLSCKSAWKQNRVRGVTKTSLGGRGGTAQSTFFQPLSQIRMKAENCGKDHEIQPWEAGAGRRSLHFFSLAASQYAVTKSSPVRPGQHGAERTFSAYMQSTCFLCMNFARQ